MKQSIFRISFILFFLSAISTTYGQKLNRKYIDFYPQKVSNARISYSEFYNDFGQLVFKYNYKYDKSGLLKSRVKKHYYDGQWLPLETQKFEYYPADKMVVCRYVPSPMREGMLDLSVKKLEQDVDTIRFDQGRIAYHSKYVVEREKGKIKRRTLNITKVVYEGDNLKNISFRGMVIDQSYDYTRSYDIASVDGRIKEIIEDKKDGSRIKFDWSNDKIQKITWEHADGGSHSNLFTFDEANAKSTDGHGDVSAYKYENKTLQSAYYSTDYCTYNIKLSVESGFGNESLLLGEYDNLGRFLEQVFLPYTFLFDDV
ncbi:MAG: hypothetical protein AAFQ94_21585 [Bacteroidota bacterium]